MELTDDGADADPLENTVANELREALHNAMRLLPAQQRAALVMVTYDGMSYAQVAHALDCPEGTVAWRISEARRKLTALLAPHLGSDED